MSFAGWEGFAWTLVQSLSASNVRTQQLRTLRPGAHTHQPGCRLTHPSLNESNDLRDIRLGIQCALSTGMTTIKCTTNTYMRTLAEDAYTWSPGGWHSYKERIGEMYDMCGHEVAGGFEDFMCEDIVQLPTWEQ